MLLYYSVLIYYLSSAPTVCFRLPTILFIIASICLSFSVFSGSCSTIDTAYDFLPAGSLCLGQLGEFHHVLARHAEHRLPVQAGVHHGLLDVEHVQQLAAHQSQGGHAVALAAHQVDFGTEYLVLALHGGECLRVDAQRGSNASTTPRISYTLFSMAGAFHVASALLPVIHRASSMRSV